MSDETHERHFATREYHTSKAVKSGAVKRFTGMMKKIAVAGNGGSFSERAAMKYVDDRYDAEQESSGLSKVLIIYAITAEGVLTALKNGVADIGIFATHNNHGGIAKENMQSAAEHRWKLETTVDLPVEHMLMMRRGRWLPNINRVDTIVTQPQAFEQCKKTVARWNGLRRMFGYQDIEIIMYEDTATAAEHLADGTLKKKYPQISLDRTAVIGPGASGSLHRLKNRSKGVNDYPNNTTTFAVARPHKEETAESTVAIDK